MPFFKQGWQKKSLNYLAKLVPNHSSPDAMGSCAKTIGCHPPIIGSRACECRFNANQYDLCSFEELFNVCFQTASSVFVCLLLPELDGAPLRHFLDIFETYL
jgi:hypothetical protein